MSLSHLLADAIVADREREIRARSPRMLGLSSGPRHPHEAEVSGLPEAATGEHDAHSQADRQAARGLGRLTVRRWPRRTAPPSSGPRRPRSARRRRPRGCRARSAGHLARAPRAPCPVESSLPIASRGQSSISVTRRQVSGSGSESSRALALTAAEKISSIRRYASRRTRTVTSSRGASRSYDAMDSAPVGQRGRTPRAGGPCPAGRRRPSPGTRGTSGAGRRGPRRGTRRPGLEDDARADRSVRVTGLSPRS